jgi:hypothetical protein
MSIGLAMQVVIRRSFFIPDTHDIDSNSYSLEFPLSNMAHTDLGGPGTSHNDRGDVDAEPVHRARSFRSRP